VREALIRLAGQGLVVTLANRSTIVAPIDVQSFPKYVEALDIAQRMNTRLAAELRTDDDLIRIARAQEVFEAVVKGGNHLAMSEANKQFHMAIATAGRNPYLSGFYERLLDQGRRMLHLHFDYLERTHDGMLLTDEHTEMLEAIRARDVERADALAHSHSRQFRDNFLRFMQENYASTISLAGPVRQV
jgi:DNA-binding GntR family transcriptional regulator